MKQKKKKLRLERKQKAFDDMIGDKKGYYKPGSIKKSE